MNKPRSISLEQTREILAGPREIPEAITREISHRLSEGEPLVDPETFNAFIKEHMAQPREADIQRAAERTGNQMIKLGSTSLLMAWMLAGDIKIPRPRRLGEHNQSVTNVYNHTLDQDLAEPRDRILRVFTTIFQDGGKSYGVALDGNSRNQKKYNLQVVRNILPHTEVLTDDEKQVIEQLSLRDMVGTAIRKYHDKNLPFEEAMYDAERELAMLRNELPEQYKDRAEHYVDAVFRADAGAHTQHPAAQYVDMATGRITPDVTDADRQVTNAKGLPMTLDRLFSEAPEDKGQLRFHRPKDLEVVRRLLPNVYRGSEQ
ncbi:MAG TPA: hypothetical protein VFH06_00945 [Candidatus Saccharimonadales bacterium]|nr:hypothetical protein [Candidatus Saccharimonadales bacterium]